MPKTFPIFKGELQSDLDANGFTINGLLLTGLNLTKASVGLGSVDNTSDANKPISIATAAALALKEPAIAPGSTDQFLVGDKTWVTFGDLALLGGVTELPLLSSRATDISSVAQVRAERNDFGSSGTFTGIQQYGTAASGSALTGGPSNANAGLLVFRGSSGVIKTTLSSPLAFGTSGVERARILLGLMVGTTTDPGVGCIRASGTIFSTGAIASGGAITSAGQLTGSNLVTSGSADVGSDLGVAGDLVVGGKLFVSGLIQSFDEIISLGDITASGAILGRAYHSTNSGCPNDTIFYSTDDSKLSYKDPVGGIHALY